MLTYTFLGSVLLVPLRLGQSRAQARHMGESYGLRQAMVDSYGPLMAAFASLNLMAASAGLTTMALVTGIPEATLGCLYLRSLRRRGETWQRYAKWKREH